MTKETKEVLDRVKAQIVEATRTMSREERERLYDALQEWAYGEYNEALLEGYEPELQD